MSYPTWDFILTDLQGNALGEVATASNRQVVRALSMPATAQFTIPITDPLYSDVIGRDLYLKCYRNSLLTFHGPVITAQLATEDPTTTPTILVTAADPSWRFDRRVAGQSATGTSFAGGTDRLQVAQSLIGTANANETGVQTLGLNCGTTLSGTYVAGPYKKLSDCIGEMGNTLAGFDWRIDPIDYNAGKIGQFNAAAILGFTRTDVVFEYQGKANARAPNFIKGIETMVNNAISVPDGGPADVGGVLTASDAASQATRGLYEEVVDTSGVTNVGLRQAIVNDHVLYRKNPRQVFTFQPDFDDGSGRTPSYGTDYQVGDYVRARFIYNGASLVDGTVRLYKMQLDIDDNSKETLTPTVVNEGG